MGAYLELVNGADLDELITHLVVDGRLLPPRWDSGENAEHLLKPFPRDRPPGLGRRHHGPGCSFLQVSVSCAELP